MKSVRTSIYLLMALLAILAACAPQATATPTDTATVEAAPPPASETPTEAGAAPTEPGATDTPTPVTLEGPPMEVGSKYVYVDLSTLIAVPGGPFIMGHGQEDNPVHTVSLSEFWIYQTEVTNRQYALCVNVGECGAPDPKTNPTFEDPYRSNDPVVGVNWQQAADYCTFVHGRLPTEAEWEKTARGPEGNIYPWGDKGPNCDLANYNLCEGKTTDVTTHPLGKSYYEGLDLAGNAYEWVADWYLSTYYGQSPEQDPLGPETGTKRSVRSNSFQSNAFLSESARRFREDPKSVRNDLGFRCVVEDPTFFAPLCEQVGVVGSGVPGGLPGSVPVLDCPTVSISQFQLECNNMQSTTNVIFNSSDPAAVIDHGSCATNYDPNPPLPEAWNCDAATNVSITANCTWTDPAPVSCAPHYTLNGNICEWDGSGSIGDECLPNFNYDPVNQCCTAEPGSGADYPLCPPGFSPAPAGPPDQYKCIPGDDPGIVQQNDVVHIKACEGPGDNGGGCNKNANSCPYGFDAANCCCIYIDPGCYAP